MKALSLTQPWATLVVLGEKEYETRSWDTKFRGLLAIHASKGFPRWAKELGENDHHFVTALGKHGISRLPLGAIIGVVELHATMDVDYAKYGMPNISRKEIAFGDYAEGRRAWKLGSPISLPEPIPCRGHLGLWNVPAEIEAQIQDAIQEGEHGRD